MAKNDTTVETWEVTFFCYQGTQYINASVLIKAGAERLNPSTWKLELDDATTKFINFSNWIYATDDEFEIEFLRAYNRWGKLSDGRKIEATPFPVISERKPNQVDAVVKEVIKEVIKKQIPAAVLELLDEAALIDMAKNEFDYEVKSEKKKDIIKEFIKEGFAA